MSEPQILQTAFSLYIEQYVSMSTEQLRNFLVYVGVIVPFHNNYTKTYSIVIDTKKRRKLCSLKVKNGKIKEVFSSPQCMI